MRRIHLVLVLLATVLGCASASTVPRPSSRPADSYRDVLTGDEIRAANGRTARDAIEVLRPWFLNLRGGSKLPVYVNGNRFDDIRDLPDVAAEVIVEIRRLNSAEATFRFGSGHPVGAIVITTRGFPDPAARRGRVRGAVPGHGYRAPSSRSERPPRTEPPSRHAEVSSYR